MTVLQALAGYYDRMAERGEAEPPGYSREKISYAILLDLDGRVVDVHDLREMSGKKMVPAMKAVPAATKRTRDIAPNTLWDKTAYTLGRTASESKRTAQEHARFVADHLTMLAGTDDEGLLALRRFLEVWQPADFDQPPFVADMLDTNVVFRLDGEQRFIHERPKSRALVAGRASDATGDTICLITGRPAAVTRLHPTIKGVDGAQSSGAALVSFNLDAFTSYGKEQGDNAPTSAEAAHRYGTALNRLLDRATSRNRIRIVDTTVVFWADAAGVGEAAAASAEGFMGMLLSETPADDASESTRLHDALKLLAEGRPAAELGLCLATGTRFHILGLAPNAARLSVRFWLDDSFDAFAARLARHWQDLRIEPTPWRNTVPAVWRLLVQTTALQEKSENVPPLLAGEVMRAILTGTRYPRSLLAAALIRLRAGDDPASGWHAAVIRACLVRDARLRLTDPAMRATAQEMLVSLDRDDPHPAYQLGRLFAALETAQRQALGRLNATIRDRYFGSASATPASVFPLLLRGAQNHLGKLRKEGKGSWIERDIEEIIGRLQGGFPRSLLLEAQGRFVIGYYHQRRTQFAGRPAESVDAEEETDHDNG